ncbi:ABC transporter substrate-binding protein [Escherichia coli]
MPELAESWEVLDNSATYRFHLRRDVPFQTRRFTPTRKMNADDVVFTSSEFLTATTRGITSTAATSPTSTACNLPIT